MRSGSWSCRGPRTRWRARARDPARRAGVAGRTAGRGRLRRVVRRIRRRWQCVTAWSGRGGAGRPGRQGGREPDDAGQPVAFPQGEQPLRLHGPGPQPSTWPWPCAGRCGRRNPGARSRLAARRKQTASALVSAPSRSMPSRCSSSSAAPFACASRSACSAACAWPKRSSNRPARATSASYLAGRCLLAHRRAHCHHADSLEHPAARPARRRPGCAAIGVPGREAPHLAK